MRAAHLGAHLESDVPDTDRRNLGGGASEVAGIRIETLHPRWAPRWPLAIGGDDRDGSALKWYVIGRGGWGAMERMIAVYIMANRKNGTIYTGVTSDLIRRVSEHREGIQEGFTKKWGCNRLVWYELHAEIGWAIHREKSIKSYRRANKINLITSLNPDWKDLWFDLAG